MDHPDQVENFIRLQIVETSKYLRILDGALASTVVLVHLASATGIKGSLYNLSLRDLEL